MKQLLEKLYRDLKRTLTAERTDVNPSSSFYEISRAISPAVISVPFTGTDADILEELPLVFKLETFATSSYCKIGYGSEFILQDEKEEATIYARAFFDLENPFLEMVVVFANKDIPILGEVFIPIGRRNCGSLAIRYAKEKPDWSSVTEEFSIAI